MKKIIVICLLLINIFTSFATSSFDDIKDHWSKEWVINLVERNISSGYPDGSFKPDNMVTVEEFITFTIKALQSIDADQYTLTSIGDYWSDPFIELAFKKNIIEEKQFENYRRAIKREEMASIIAKAYGLENPVTSSNIKMDVIDSMYDYYMITDQYKDTMLTSIAEGFISGKDMINDKIVVDPQGTATRGEAAVLLIKLLESEKRTPFISDRPSTTFKSSLYTGAVKGKIDSTYYAAKNTEGQYVTEIFDIQHYFETFDFNRIDANFSYHSNLVTVDFIAKEKYKEYYLGDFWLLEKIDMMLEYDENNYLYDVAPYTLNVWSDAWFTADYDEPVDYLKGEYDEYIIYICNYFFEKEADRALELIYSGFVDHHSDIIYKINGREVGISGTSNNVQVWFDEKVE